MALMLVLVTHSQKMLEVECDEVTVPGAEGEMGILPGHTGIISTLLPGLLTYTDSSGTHRYAVSSGFCEMSGNVLTVLVDRAQKAEDIDLEQARADRDHAASELAQAGIEVDEVARLQEQLADAEARLMIAGGEAH